MTLLTHWEGERLATLEHVWGVDHLEAHDRIGSTNDRARELARSGLRGFTVVVAETQVAGRGRGGAEWFSPPGSGLWLSVAVPGDVELPLHLPLLVGLATARAIEATTPSAVGIEWPNDLQVEGKKVAGILCERAGPAMIVGVGINVRTPEDGFPEDIADRAGGLEARGGARVSRTLLAGALLRRLKALPTDLKLRQADHAELSSRDVLLDRPVMTEQAGAGVARGIDRAGGLMLEREDGSRVRVVAGSVRPQ